LAKDNFDKKIYIQRCEIVRWPTNAFQNLHLDSAHQNNILTSITYLNDDYEGGETYMFQDIKVVPKTGRTVFFNGHYYQHGVNEIRSGSRYTLPIWYNLNEETTIK
jgi:hypothetical protein